MSATGQGGLTQISVTLAAAGSAGSKYTFTHNVGRALQIATAVDANGNTITGVTVLQTSLNACVIQNLTSSSQAVLVTLQWEELSTKLNVVKTTDARMTSGTTDATPVLYVATTGSDTIGDGSQSAPFATIQRALDTFPVPVPAGAEIQLGAGTFTAPTRWPSAILGLNIFGDRSQPTISLSGNTWALVAGTTSRWRSNVGAYSATIGLGTHWVEHSFNFGSGIMYPLATATVASASPNIDSYSNPSLGGFVPGVAVHPFVTSVRTAVNSVLSTASTLTVPRNVLFVGCTLTNATAFIADVNVNSGFLGCRALGGGPVIGGYGGTANLISLNAGGTAPTFMYVGRQSGAAFLTLQVCASQVDATFYASPANATLSGLISGTSAVGTEVIVNSGTLALGDANSGLDWEDNRAVVCISVAAGARVTQATAVKVIGTGRTRFMNLLGPGSSFERTAGTITGVISGIPVILTNASQAIGIKAAASGTLTNGSTPGNEITVGGNAVTTFAAQPTTDVGAAAPQFCRAT